jgi:hypothetical protein
MSLGDVHQQLKTTDPGRPKKEPRLSKNNERKERNWARFPDGCLTARLTVGSNITLNLTFALVSQLNLKLKTVNMMMTPERLRRENAFVGKAHHQL